MASKKYFFSAATLSWIDPATNLPEHDQSGGPGPLLTFTDVTASRICRFANLLVCSITVEADKIVKIEVAPESGLHMRPSFLGTIPKPYPTRKDYRKTTSDATFVQTAGARTQAPKIIGRTAGEIIGASEGLAFGPFAFFAGIMIGERAGSAVARRALPFPPIWTTMQVVVKASGDASGVVLKQSKFPSMTYYECPCWDGEYQLSQRVWKRVNVYKGQYDPWMAQGWGHGNPWVETRGF